MAVHMLDKTIRCPDCRIRSQSDRRSVAFPPPSHRGTIRECRYRVIGGTTQWRSPWIIRGASLLLKMRVSLIGSGALLQGARPLLAGQCLLLSPQFFQDDGFIVPCVGFFRCEGCGLIQCCQCLIHTAKREERETLIVPGCDIVWIDDQCAVKCDERLPMALQLV